VTSKEWTQFVSQWMRDPVLQADAKAGRLDALRRAGFALDESDLRILQTYSEMQESATDLETGIARPFFWANADGPVCEAVAAFESPLQGGQQMSDLLVWSGDSGLVKRIKERHYYSGFRHEFNALAVSECRGSEGPIPAIGTFRVATAWRVGHAATQFRANFIVHDPKGHPTTTGNFELWDLLYADGAEPLAIVPDLQIIRLEWDPDDGEAKFIGEELVTLIRLMAGRAGYRGGLILRRQVSAAGIPPEFHLMAAFDPAPNFDTANNSVDNGLADWSMAAGARPVERDRRSEWLVRLNTVGAAPVGPL
jgi:hypothetical protein